MATDTPHGDDGDLDQRVRAVRASLEIYEAVLAAMDRRREIVDLVETAATEDVAVDQVRELLGVTDHGARAVLDLQLRRLTVDGRDRIQRLQDEQRWHLASLTT